MKELLLLFGAFFKIGICTFGGGLSMLPVITRELVTLRSWCTEEEITDYYAVGQCTPGIIAVNVATFIGMKRRGVAGAISATLGLVFSSLIIITVIAALISGFAENVWVRHALSGIRAAVCGLIAVTVFRMIKKNVRSLFDIAVAVIALLLIFIVKLSPVFVVIGAAAAGLVRYAFLLRAAKTGRQDKPGNPDKPGKPGDGGKL